MTTTQYEQQAPYTADKAPLPRTSEELRARIPGWGADLDPADRPSVPREQDLRSLTDAHWEFPERQPEPGARERSVEHGILPPVFGTSCPLHGASGAIRRLAYDRFSEGRAAHWLLLLAGDRVDVAESRVTDALRGRPDRVVRETGVRAELTHHGLSSRLHSSRKDKRHHVIDPVVVMAPWLIGGGVAVAVFRRLTRA
jgi:hypothetical protein